MTTFDNEYEVDVNELLNDDSGFHSDDLNEESVYEDYILDRYDGYINDEEMESVDK